MLRWFEDMVDVGDLAQKLFFSVGEGCSKVQQCFFPPLAGVKMAHREVDAAIIDHCAESISFIHSICTRDLYH